MNNRHIELKAENERLRALLAARTEEVNQAHFHGVIQNDARIERVERLLRFAYAALDGLATLPIHRELVTDIRAALAATKDAVPTCVKCGEIEGAHDEQEVVQVGHVFIAATKG